MTVRPRPGMSLAVAAALAGTTPVAPPAAADDEPLVEHCYTQALTPEEAAAGAVSEIDCYEVSADEPPMALRGTVTWAVAYDNANGSGDEFWIFGPSCTGGAIVFGTGHVFDNRISSIDLVACGAAKNWQWSNFSGSHQLVLGIGLTAMTGTMNNATSSIEFA